MTILPLPDDKPQKIDLAKLPAKVRKAADAAVPGAKWEEAHKDTEEGVVIYELDGTNARGRDVTVMVTAEGKVTEVETELPLTEVPQLVRDALKAKMPRFKITAAFEIREEGKVTSYDFEGKRPKDKEEITVSVSVDGKTIEIEDGK